MIRRSGGTWGERTTLAGREVPTPGGSLPSFSPDGRSVLFVDAPFASIVPVAGGPVRRVVDLPDLRVLNAAWSPDGRSIYAIVEAATGTSSIWEVPLGGAPRRLATFDGTERQPTRYGMVVRQGRLYLTYGERQADVSVVSLAPAD